MTRTRSEYRLAPIPAIEAPDVTVRPVAESDRDDLAQLLLDAYRGTIDDEGEDLDDARGAIDHYLTIIVRDHSFIVPGHDRPVAMSLVVVVDGVHYIDPVAVAAPHQQRGLGRAAVVTSLRSLAAAGTDEVGATITDGNEPSVRLFTSLGFERRGAWG